MQSISDPLNRLHEDGSWFARARDVRLLTVRCTGDLRKSVLALLPMFEFHADNRSPWVVLPDAHTREGSGWKIRAARLLQDWERRREAFAEESIAMPAAALARPGGTDLVRFQQTAGSVAAALRAPLDGLVLVLAPSIVEDAESFSADLSALLGDPTLHPCRWVVVVDDDQPTPRVLLESLGDRALLCDCTIDRAAQSRDLSALMASGGSASPATFGIAAPPGVVPPPRVGDPPPLPIAERDTMLREAGIAPAYLEQAPKIRDKVLGAAISMHHGKGADAVSQQREARDLCASLGLHELKVITQVALASYLSGVEQRHLAIAELEDAERYAAAHDLPQVQSQALLALGLLHALDGRLGAAVGAYGSAGRTAEAAKLEIIAIEAWRLAGQLALEAGQSVQAVSCLGEAIRIASGSTPDVAKTSSASEAARRLAELSKKRGLMAQADSLYAQADRFEAGEPA